MKYRALHSFLFMALMPISACNVEFSADRINEAPDIGANYYQASLNALNDQIEDFPSNADAYYKKALVLQKLERNKAGIISINNAIQRKNKAEYYLLLAELLYEDDQGGEAIQAALNAESMGVSATKAYSMLADLYFSEKEYLKSLAYANKILENNANDHEAYVQIGKIFLATRDTMIAERNLLKSIDLEPHNPAAYQSMVDINFGRGKYSKALSYLNENLKNTPENINLIFQKASIYQATDSLDKSHKLLQEITRIDKNNYNAWHALAKMKLEERKYDSAVVYASKSVEVNETFDKGWMLLGQIYDRAGNYTLAKFQYENILARDSTVVEANAALQKLNGKVAYLRELQRLRKERESFKALRPRGKEEIK